jgi:hypothetical protein
MITLLDVATLSIAATLVGYVALWIMVIAVNDQSELDAYGKGLTDPSSGQFLPRSYWFFHTKTTSHYRNKGLLPFLQMMRGLLVLGIVGLIASLVRVAI